MDSAHTRFRLSLLGHFELQDVSGPITLPSGKLCGLLAFLACTPRGCSRDYLMTLLWGSHFQAQARQNLRQSLTRLRRILGQGAFDGNGEVVRLRPGLVSCDVEKFEVSVHLPTRDALMEAARVYRGPFLEGLVIAGEEWTDWLTLQRQNLENQALDLLIRVAELQMRSGDMKEAMVSALRAIAINNFREDAHRIAMRAIAATGNKALALKHYNKLCHDLRQELNVEPSAGTQAVAAELRQGRISVSLAELTSFARKRFNPRPRADVDWHPPCYLPKWHE
jgi:DNA-binding SARP family transcriptional activator